MVKRTTPRLDALFARILRLTNDRGAKAKLARSIRVVPQRLNDWLSGLNEPGGETALQLLEWVTAEEAKQKGEAGRVGARPARKTQVKKATTNDKQHSGRTRK